MRLRVGDRSLLVACASWSFGCLPLATAARVIRALGFGHIDVGFGHLPLYGSGSPRGQGSRLKQSLLGQGLKISDLFPLLPYETNDCDPDHRGENARMLRRVVAFAKGCGSPGITLKPGIPQPAASDRGWLASVEALREYTGLARSSGVLLSVEPHVDSLIEDPRAARLLVEQVPGMMLTLDYSHFIALGFPPRDVTMLHPWARHFHLRQARTGRLQTAVKDGIIPAARIVEELVASGYRGGISLEYQNSGWHDCNDIDVISETVATLRALGIEVPRRVPTSP